MIALVMAAAAGWWAAGRFESPAQRAAGAEAPPAVPVFAAVQRGVLTEQITAQATVTTAQSRDVPLTIPTDALSTVVTANLATDATLMETGPVLAVNDRPVFAISGDFPLWRDLSPGATGADVRQVQAALRAAGHDIPDRELGTFGKTTTAAIRAVYKAAGYPVSTVPGGVEQPAAPQPAAPPPPGSDAPTAPAAPQAPQVTAPVLVLPAAELVVIPGGLPAQVAALPPVGTVLTTDNDYLSLVSGVPTATADLPEAVSARATPGTRGTLSVNSEAPAAVEVSEVVPGDATAGTSPRAVLVATDGAALPESWVGGQGLLTLTLTSVADEALLVPSRAIAVGADGSARVLKRLPDESLETVTVRNLGELRGVTAVEPVRADALTVDDQIQVG